MKIISAKILDQTHLELVQPIFIKTGEFINISIIDNDEDENLWHQASKKHLLETYAPEDAIYDDEWIEIAKARYNLYKAGKIDSKSFEEVFEQAYSNLKK